MTIILDILVLIIAWPVLIAQQLGADSATMFLATIFNLVWFFMVALFLSKFCKNNYYDVN